MTSTLPPSSDDLLDTLAVARDCWPGGTLELWQGGERLPRPSRVYWPEDEDTLQALLAEASEHSIPVVPFGMGSGVCGGARGREGSWVVDTKRLRRIDPIDEEGWTVRVQAGVNGQELEDRLAEQGFTLGHSPSSIACSSVGGWAAARSAGQFSSRYGVFEDMVLGLSAVTPTGRVDVGLHGDDDPGLLPLLLGSEGTLGVITELTLRVWRTPETRWLRGYRFRTVEEALDAVRRVMQGELWPSVVRIYDPVDTGIGGKTRPKREKRQAGFLRGWLKGVADLDPVKRRTLALPLRLPGVVNRIFEQVAAGCLLVVGWEGRREVVEASVAAGRAILEEQGEDLGAGPGQRWYASRHAVSYKMMPVFERGGFADTMEVAARWSRLPAVYHAVREAVRPHAVVLAHMSHVYPEGGSIYFSFAGRGDAGVYRRVWEVAQEAALREGATISHHHGVGSLKVPWASAEVGAAVEGWHEARDALDPVGVMNPGRLFGPTPPRDAGPDPRLHEDDGLLRVPLEEDLDARVARASARGEELAYPWENLPAPPRWLREAWQIDWSEVSGRVGARQARLGRGPRSAVGPDLRIWLARKGSHVHCTVPTVPAGERWMGRARLDDPWRTARELVRSDLRPSVLTVDGEGDLLIGFRGPAAHAFGALVDRWVCGGVEEIDYRPVTLEGGSLVPGWLSDEGLVSVGVHHVARRRT